MTSHPQHRPAVPPGLVLAAAIVGISTAGPLVRSSAAHPVAIALWRLVFSLAIIAVPFIATRAWREWTILTRRELAIAGGAGAMLALHFWSWNASVHLTTIAASVTLVSIQPAIVAAISAVYLRERPTGWQIAGIALAIAGAVIISLPGFMPAELDGRGPSNPRLGNLLAVLGAVTAAAYYVAGRRLRGKLGIWSYVGLVYTACLVALAVIAAFSGVPLVPQPPRELAIFAGLAIGPMLLGHTGMNWALRYRPAYVVNLTVLAEPIGASLLAAMLPWVREIPPPATLVGGAIVLGGIALASRTRTDAAGAAESR